MQLAQTRTRRTSGMSKPAGKPPGTILGVVNLPDRILSEAAKLADEAFAYAGENGFAGDQVETYAVPRWASRDSHLWLPDPDALGYRRADGGFRGRDVGGRFAH